MTISPWTLYWILRLDALKGALIGLIVLSVAVVVVCLIAHGIMYGDDKVIMPPESLHKLKRRCFTSVFVGVLLFCVDALTPTTKEMAVLCVLPRIANSKMVTETLPQEFGELYQLTKAWLEKQ